MSIAACRLFVAVVVVWAVLAPAALPAAATQAHEVTCDDADVDGDGVVDGDDVTAVSNTVWGPCPGGEDPCPADVDGDGDVDIDDLTPIFDLFGADCSNWPPVELIEPVEGTYVDSAGVIVDYTLAAGFTVTSMTLNGTAVPIVPPGSTITLPEKDAYVLRVDVADGQGGSGIANVQFTYSTENCPFRNLTPSPAACDFRLMLQGRYTDAALGVYGLSPRAISLGGSWFQGGNITTDTFIAEAVENPAGIRTRLVNLICSDDRQLQMLAPEDCGLGPAAASDDVVLIDIEQPEPLHRYVNYPDGSQLRNDMLAALATRIAIARDVMPNAKLVLWGHQPNPRGRDDTNFADRLELFKDAGDLGVYDHLDYYMPLLYSHYGPNDFRWVVVGGVTYNVEVTYDSSLGGEDYTHLFSFFDPDLAPEDGWLGALAIWVDPLTAADTVTLGGETFVAVEGSGDEEFAIESLTDGANYPMDPSEVFYLEIVQRYANQGLSIPAFLGQWWPKPVAPLFSFNIFEKNTDHSRQIVPFNMARTLVDTVQLDPAVQMVLYWDARWRREIETFFRGLEPVSRSCGCVVNDCTDRIDNDGDTTTDDYDAECGAGVACDFPTARLDDEANPNLPPDSVVHEPVSDLQILVGDSVMMRGGGIDPEGEVHLEYLWEFGIGSGLEDREGLIPTCRYCAEGTHTLSFTATDSYWRGDPTPATRQITVGCRTPTTAVTLTAGKDESNGDTILTIADADGMCLATGYNVYRGLSAQALSLQAQDIQDGLPDFDNVQFVDTGSNGEPFLFYRVNAYNGICDAEGP